MSDSIVAAVGRNLAQALGIVARSRSEEDKKAVAALLTELCAAVRLEREEQAAAERENKP